MLPHPAQTPRHRPSHNFDDLGAQPPPDIPVDAVFPRTWDALAMPPRQHLTPPQHLAPRQDHAPHHAHAARQHFAPPHDIPTRHNIPTRHDIPARHDFPPRPDVAPRLDLAHAPPRFEPARDHAHTHAHTHPNPHPHTYLPRPDFLSRSEYLPIPPSDIYSTPDFPPLDIQAPDPHSFSSSASASTAPSPAPASHPPFDDVDASLTSIAYPLPSSRPSDDPRVVGLAPPPTQPPRPHSSPPTPAPLRLVHPPPTLPPPFRHLPLPPQTKQHRRYNTPRSSKYCHLCARHSRSVAMLSCGNIHRGLCQKSVCHKCFTAYAPSLDWDTAAVNAGADWACPHCQGNCPRRAKCFAYDRQTVRRRAKTQAARVAKGKN